MYDPVFDGGKGNVQQEPDRSYQPDANENRGNPKQLSRVRNHETETPLSAYEFGRHNNGPTKG